MEYHEAASFLSEAKGPPNLGTERTRAVLSEIGDPHEDLRAVQVAGTNGKGSTAALLAGVLRETGLSVGVFSSPHLETFRESVTVDGRKIPKAAVADFVAEVREFVTDRAVDGEAPSFFELLTALACREFARQDVDVAVFEVGMGGARDATSVVDPVASAVTSVAVDHETFFGDSIDSIAPELAGVAPADEPLVTAATGEGLHALSAEVGDLHLVGEDDADTVFSYEGITNHLADVHVGGDGWEVATSLQLLGEHQARNAGVAAALARQVADVSERDLERGLTRAHLPGRFEVVERNPLLVLDGAHNPAACATTAATLEAFECDAVHLVVGAMADKDLRGIADALPAPDSVVACAATRDRAAKPSVVARTFDRAVATDDVRTRDSVSEAVSAALDAAGEDDCVLVTGSLAVVAEARTCWTRRTVEKRVESVPQARTALTDADVPVDVADRVAGDAVHHVVETEASPGIARRLREEFVALGGECAVSGVQDPSETVSVTLMGTDSHFEDLQERLGTAEAFGTLSHGIDRVLGEKSAPSWYPWADGPAVMGVLDVGEEADREGVDALVERAQTMADHGADVVEVAPEAGHIDPERADTEGTDVAAVVEALVDVDALVAVPAGSASGARIALEAGADVVVDVAGTDPDLPRVVADERAALVVGGVPETPTERTARGETDAATAPKTDPVTATQEDMAERLLLAERAGMNRRHVVLAPRLETGMGTVRDGLHRIGEFHGFGCPVAFDVSHVRCNLDESFSHVGDSLREDRFAVATATIVASRGVDLLRVRDVPAAQTALAVADAAAWSAPEET